MPVRLAATGEVFVTVIYWFWGANAFNLETNEPPSFNFLAVWRFFIGGMSGGLRLRDIGAHPRLPARGESGPKRRLSRHKSHGPVSLAGGRQFGGNEGMGGGGEQGHF